MENSSDANVQNNEIHVKRKKGRPKKIKTDEKSNENPNESNIIGNNIDNNMFNNNNTLNNSSNCNQTEIVIEKKKRGRKKKPVVEEVKQKKKRGRKAALKYFSSSIRKQIPLTTIMNNTNNYILHIDTNEEQNDKNNILELPGIENDNEVPEFVNEIKEMLKNDEDILSDYLDNCEINNEENLRELYEQRIENREKQDKLLFEKLENIHNNEEMLAKMTKMINNSKTHETTCDNEQLEDTQTINRKKGYFEILHNFVQNESWLHNTDVLCWWCCHSFNTIPLGLPEEYDIKTKKFRVKGIFCSFPCMLAYNNEMWKKNGYKKYLIKHLYSKITGNPINTHIKSAPPRCCLKKFGGEMSIDEFRTTSDDNTKVYKLVEYPMYISKDYIEEVDLINVKNANLKVFNVNNNISNTKNIINTDHKKIQDAKSRIEEKIVVTGNNTIDKFIL